MKSETISAIHDFALDARELLQREVEEQFEGIYGWLPDGKFQPPGKYPAINTLDHAKDTRSALEQFVEDELAAGVKPNEAREKLVKEAAFTWLNRLVAFKMMETRGLIKGAVSKGSDSNAFKFWVVEDGNEAEYEKFELGDLPQNALGEGPRQEAYRHFILWQCGKLAEEIKVLFDPDNLASRLFPRPAMLNDLIELMIVSELEEAWAPGNEETIGWIYQGFNSRELEEAFREARVSGKKFESEDIPAVSQLFTPRWIVRYLVENTLGRLWIEMHPDSELAQDLKYLVPLDTARTEPVKLAREITMLDPACGTMHFGLIAFDIFVRMYEEEIDRKGKPGWPEEPSTKTKEDIPSAIISENIHGIDIDLRAVQLAALVLFMKAKSLVPGTRIAESNLACANVSTLDDIRCREFAEHSGLKHPIYSRLLKLLYEHLENSKQLGSLLKLEERIPLLVKEERELYEREGRQPDLFGWSDEQFETEAGRTEFWEILGKQIGQAANEFAKMQARRGYHQSLFVDETTKGLRLLELLRTKYDVVVTNPPYVSNRKMNSELKAFVSRDYPEGKMDLYAAFVQRCCLLVERHGGRVGMLTMHSFMFITSYEKLRIWLSQNIYVESLVHCGPALFNVGNPGTLQTCAYVLRSDIDVEFRNKSAGSYFRLVQEPDGDHKRVRFEKALNNIKQGQEDSTVFRYSQGDFSAIPGIPWVYWLQRGIRSVFERLPKLSDAAEPRYGLSSSDNVRFLRFWWEVGLSRIAFNCRSQLDALLAEKKWIPHLKGGPSRQWWGNQDYVVNWWRGGEEMKSWVVSNPSNPGTKQWSRNIRNHDYYFRGGVTWSRTTANTIAARLMPAGFIFDSEAACVFSGDDSFVLGILNSSVAKHLVDLINPTIHIQTGDLARMPFPNCRSSKLRSLADEAVVQSKVYCETDELTFSFIAPSDWGNGIEHLMSVNARLKIIQDEIDKEVWRLYGFIGDDTEDIKSGLTSAPALEPNEKTRIDGENMQLISSDAQAALTREQLAVHWISYVTGIVLDRFKPGTANGLGRGTFADEIATKLNALSDEAGIMVMEHGHPFDLTRRVLEALIIALGFDEACKVVKTATRKEGPIETLLRQYLAKDFDKFHIQQYRKRPVYWFLQSPKKKYGLWVFHERLTKDSLFRIRSEYVEAKIRLLEGQIADIQNTANAAGGKEKRKLEKEIAPLQDVLDDVREFERLMKHISEVRGYTPHIDDGVLLNMAPLWELIPSWQAEPKKAWEELEAGKYDWSYQAMDHWPERVREKCKTNKSYAIAHGLLDLYEEHNQGKKK